MSTLNPTLVFHTQIKVQLHWCYNVSTSWRSEQRPTCAAHIAMLHCCCWLLKLPTCLETAPLMRCILCLLYVWNVAAGLRAALGQWGMGHGVADLGERRWRVVHFMLKFAPLCRFTSSGQNSFHQILNVLKWVSRNEAVSRYIGADCCGLDLHE